MKKVTAILALLTIISLTSLVSADEVFDGAFTGAATGAIIGGAAGGGRGAGIGAGVGLGLGLIGGGIAQSRRERREQRYATQRLRDRREEYAHELIMGPDEELAGLQGSDLDDHDYQTVETAPIAEIESTQAQDHSTIDTATDDTESSPEDFKPAKGIEVSYEDEV